MFNDLAEAMGFKALEVLANHKFAGCEGWMDVIGQLDTSWPWAIHLWKTARSDVRLDMVVPGVVFITPLHWSNEFWDGTLRAHHGARRAAGRREGGQAPRQGHHRRDAGGLPAAPRVSRAVDPVPCLQDVDPDNQDGSAALAQNLAETDDEASGDGDLIDRDNEIMEDLIDALWAELHPNEPEGDNQDVRDPEGDGAGEGGDCLGGGDGDIGEVGLAGGSDEIQITSNMFVWDIESNDLNNARSTCTYAFGCYSMSCGIACSSAHRRVVLHSSRLFHTCHEPGRG